MERLAYWIGTAFSKPVEVEAFVAGVLAFSVAIAMYSGKKAVFATAAGVVLLAAVLLLNAPFQPEWHYWGGGAGVALLGKFLYDRGGLLAVRRT